MHFIQRRRQPAISAQAEANSLHLSNNAFSGCIIPAPYAKLTHGD
ncbi:MAG: hypothetical protein ABR956_01260 [Terracidiphilus sp.]|jgi:hypothetical protein